MKVLLAVRDFPPVLNSMARLFYELAEDLLRYRYEVTVLTLVPERYLATQERKSRTCFFLLEELNCIKVWRIKSLPIPYHLPMARIVEQLWITLTFLIAGFFLPRQDAIILYSPPLPLGITGYLLARRWRSAVIVNVQDLYPQTAIDLKLLRNPFIIRLAEKLERFIYQKVDALTVHSEGNRQYLISRGAPSDHVHVVYNWVDLELVRPAPRQNSWRRLHHLDKAFIVSFAGTMGFAQGLEDIVQVAEQLRQFSDIVFVLAGDGVFREDLKKYAESKNLRNIRFLPPQPPEDYVKLLQASDVSLVTLQKDLKTPVVPGKLQSIMAAGRPVICYANPISDSKRIIEEANCGFFVNAGDIVGLERAILALYRKPELAAQMGQRARRYAEQHFDRSKCTRQYVALLEKLKNRTEGVS